MKSTRLALVALLSAAAFGAHADEADGSQRALAFQGAATRAQVQAELAAYRQAGVNTYATRYNPLYAFQSSRSRAEVRAEALAHRDAATAFNGEDSGSAYLSARRSFRTTGTQVAGNPVNAQ